MEQLRTRLTHVEQSMTEQRILLDAQLILGGAQCDEHGRLVIGGAQLEQIRTTGDVLGRIGMSDFDSDPKVKEQERQAELEGWYDQSVESSFMVDGRPRFHSVRVVNALQKSNVRTIRDVLILGKHGTLEVKGIAYAGINDLNQRFEDNDYGVEWKTMPSYTDIAKLSKDLSQVPSQILKCPHMMPESADTNWIYKMPYTVQDVLNTTNISEKQQWADDEMLLQSWTEYKELALKAATVFADKYAAEKQRLAAGRPVLV
jgi:hypothetical protein